MFRYTFAKGHATGNDFIIIDDPHGMQDLSAEAVAALCDRHTGVGGDNEEIGRASCRERV